MGLMTFFGAWVLRDEGFWIRVLGWEGFIGRVVPRDI